MGSCPPARPPVDAPTTPAARLQPDDLRLPVGGRQERRALGDQPLEGGGDRVQVAQLLERRHLLVRAAPHTCAIHAGMTRRYSHRQSEKMDARAATARHCRWCRWCWRPTADLPFGALALLLGARKLALRGGNPPPLVLQHLARGVAC